MLSPIEMAIQLVFATISILFVWRCLIPSVAGHIQDLFEFRVWRR